MSCLNMNVEVMMSCRSFACVLAVTLGLVILLDHGTFGVNAKQIAGGTRSPQSPPRPETVDRSMQSGVQYPSPDIPTPPEEGYDEAEDGLRQEMMSVLLPYLQASSEGAPSGSVEGDGREFHENNVIGESSSMSLSSQDHDDEPLFSKRFNKRLNMNAPPEEPINHHEMQEAGNTSSKPLPSQLLSNVTVEFTAHLVTTVTPQHGGVVLRSTNYPAWSQRAPMDESMGVRNSETEGNVGHDALFPYGGQGFSQVPHRNGITVPEDGGSSQSESTNRDAVREEMPPPRDLSRYRGMDGISRPEPPMFSGDGNTFDSVSPLVFPTSDLSFPSSETITSSSSPENLGPVSTMISNTMEPALLSNHSSLPEDILVNSEQQPPQISQTDSIQDLSTPTGMPLLPQGSNEVPSSTRFDSDSPSSSHDLPGGTDDNRDDHFPMFQSTTSGSAAETDKRMVGDGSNFGGTLVSNDEGSGSGSTPTTLLVTTEEIKDQFSRQLLFGNDSSSAQKLQKLTSVASVFCGLLLHGISRRLA